MSLSAVERKSENDLLLSRSNFISSERLAVVQLWVSIISGDLIIYWKVALEGQVKHHESIYHQETEHLQEMIPELQSE